MDKLKLYDKPGRPKKYTDEEALEQRRKSLREAQRRYYERNKDMIRRRYYEITRLKK